MSDPIRIAKHLARAGVASRRDVERMIAEGRITLNGVPVETPATLVTAADKMTVDGKPVAAAEPARLWLYHKPLGLVTSARDEKDRETVFDALPADMPRVMSVGRLDINSEGLLLLTNDGALKRHLELPSTGWLRRYRVRVHGRPSEAQLEPLRQGIEIEGEKFLPMQVVMDRQQGANAWLTIGLREGKNREIRRALEAQNLPVSRLIRVSYGPFQLGKLEDGAVQEIKARMLREQLGEALALELLGPAPGPEAVAQGKGKPSGKFGRTGAPRDGKKPGFGSDDRGDYKGGPKGGAKPGPRPKSAKPAALNPRKSLRKKPKA